MKILIGTYNIAGWITEYEFAFKKLGHSVTTTVFIKPDFYGDSCDVNLSKLYPRDFEKYDKTHLFKRAKRKLKNSINYNLYKAKIKQLINDHDLIILIWSPFFDDFSDFQYIKKKKKKLITIFIGSDARYFNAFVQEFKVTQWSFPSDLVFGSPDYHLNLIRNAEKYSDLIYSVPDQAGLQLRPYRHLQVPIRLSKLEFVESKNNNVPVIVHAPSIAHKKGSDIILSTLDRLRSEGISFELKFVQNMPHNQLIKLLSESDILVDEIVMHGPGTLSFEAMASGCAVATKFHKRNTAFFKPPVWNIDYDNIYEQLKRLIVDVDLRKQLVKDGYNYVKKNNDSISVCNQILCDLDTPDEYDYRPNFLRYYYIPRNEEEVNRINLWSSFVNDCSWYIKYITPGTREGMIF